MSRTKQGEPLASATPALGTMQDPATSSAAPLRSLSRLERLPNEVRHRIYGYLGIPIAGWLWVEQHKKRTASLLPANLVLRYGLQRLQHGRASEEKTVCHYERREKIRAVTFHWYNTKAAMIWTEQSEDPITFDLSAIFDVCKSIRAEALKLLFERARVQFDYELTREAIYRTFRAIGGSQERVTYHRMAVNPDYFAFMTRVYLNEQVSLTHFKRVGGIQPVYRRHEDSAAIALTKQISSILFIADHCPELVELRIDLALPGCLDICSLWPLLGTEPLKRVSIKSLRSAFLRVVEKCPKLKRILLPKAVREQHEELDFGRHSITTLILDIGNVEVALRKEHSRLWLKSVLDELAFNGGER